MTERNKIDIDARWPPELDSKLIESYEYQRSPRQGTREATENVIGRIDCKIAKLATLGLRPHPIMVDYRQELIEQLNNNGPYRVRYASGTF
jgi:hypothetical protein